MTPKHICILTTAHATDDMRVYEKIAKTFLDKEYKVSWIGPAYSLFHKNSDSDKRIEWQLFPHQPGISGRLKHIREVYKALKSLKGVDMIYCPDPDSAFIAAHAKPHKEIKVIFDIHEVYHKDLLNRKFSGAQIRIMSKMVLSIIKHTVKKCDLVMAVSNTVVDYYKGVRKDFLIIRSCAPISLLQNTSGNVTPKNPYFTVVHGKNHIARGTSVVLEAIDLLKNEEKNFKVLMIDLYGVLDGNTDNPYSKEMGKKNIASYVDLQRGMSFEQMQLELLKCHAGLISYGKDLGVDSLPNRLFEYMSAGMPVIAPSYAKEIVQILEADKCGIAVDMENPSEIADAVKYLINHPHEGEQMGINGRKAFAERHNWEAEVLPLLKYIDSNGSRN